MRREPRESAIDNGRDSFNRDRALRHVRRENKLTFGCRQQNAILLRRGKIAMEWKDEQAHLARDGLALPRRASDLSDPRKKYQHVAGVLLHAEPLYRLPDLCM